jgi:RNA polymerase sigma-70 factor (ECF subfamily)
LLEQIKLRQPAAWERFVDLYGPLIYRWCRDLGVTAADAPDVVQEAFLAVGVHVAEFRRERPGDSFRGWLWTITRNKIRDQARRRQGEVRAAGGSEANQRLSQVPDLPPDTSLGDQPASELSFLARRALEVLEQEVETRTWQAFRRVVIDGQSVAAVADELGMSIRAVYEAKYRVFRRLRQELSDLV